MPTLDARVLNKIRSEFSGDEKSVLNGPNQGKGRMDIACWNWALTGIVEQETMVKPDTLYSYVAADTMYAKMGGERQGVTAEFFFDFMVQTNAREKGWLGQRVNKSAIEKIRNNWNSSDQKAHAISETAKATSELACQANGLTVVERDTPYKIGLYLKKETKAGTKIDLPSFDHWWILIEGVTFELFPTLDDIQAARNPQGVEGNNHYFVWYHNVLELHERQVSRIMDTMGFWQSTRLARQCAVCRKEFGVWTWKHHCRVCGRVVCDACSTTRQLVKNAKLRTGYGSVPGTVRVCDDCKSPS
jgi:hypothetical protein